MGRKWIGLQRQPHGACKPSGSLREPLRASTIHAPLTRRGLSLEAMWRKCGSSTVGFWRLLEASGGFWRLLEVSGGFWRGYWRLLEAAGASEGFWRLLEASGGAIGGSWRLLEAPGGSWKLPGWRASRLIHQTPQGHKSSRQASGGFWRPLEASGMAVKPKSLKKHWNLKQN